MLGLYINSSINIYYHCERRSRYETSHRLFTSKYDETTIFAAQKQAIEAIAENIIFKYINFIATNNQDAKIIVVVMTNDTINSTRTM